MQHRLLTLILKKPRSSKSVMFTWLLLLVQLHPVKAQQSTKADSQAAKVHFQKAKQLYEQNQIREAAAEFDQAWKLNPMPVYLLDEAQCYYTLKEKEQAIKLLTQYLQINDDNPKARSVVRQELTKLGV